MLRVLDEFLIKEIIEGFKLIREVSKIVDDFKMPSYLYKYKELVWIERMSRYITNYLIEVNNEEELYDGVMTVMKNKDKNLYEFKVEEILNKALENPDMKYCGCGKCRYCKDLIDEWESHQYSVYKMNLKFKDVVDLTSLTHLEYYILFSTIKKCFNDKNTVIHYELLGKSELEVYYYENYYEEDVSDLFSGSDVVKFFKKILNIK